MLGGGGGGGTRTSDAVSGSSQCQSATETKRDYASCDCSLKFRLCPFGEVLMSILATCVSSWSRVKQRVQGMRCGN
jgi:hypothetical protein